MLFRKRVLKLNYNNNKIDTRKVIDTDYFSTYISITDFISNYLDKNGNATKQGYIDFMNAKESWNNDLISMIHENVSKDFLYNKFEFLKSANIELCFREENKFLFAMYDDIGIDINSLVILGRSLTGEKDIDRLLNSEDFEVIVTTIYLYILFVRENFSKNKDKIREFIKTRKISGDDLPSDFDGLSILVWKFARDVQALNYACSQITRTKRSLAIKTSNTLKAAYITTCLTQLNKFNL